MARIYNRTNWTITQWNVSFLFTEQLTRDSCSICLSIFPWRNHSQCLLTNRPLSWPYLPTSDSCNIACKTCITFTSSEPFSLIKFLLGTYTDDMILMQIRICISFPASQKPGKEIWKVSTWIWIQNKVISSLDLFILQHKHKDINSFAKIYKIISSLTKTIDIQAY